MKKVALFVFLSCIQLLAHADGYWFYLKGSGKANEPVTIRVCYGGVDDAGGRYLKTSEQLDKLAGFKVYVIDRNGVRSDISIRQMADCWEGVFVPKMAGTYQVLGINETLPVVDRSANSAPNIRPVQYLCALYTVGSPESIPIPKQFLDIVATQNGKLVNAQAFIEQHPVAKDTKLRIFNPENWEKWPLTDEAGKVSFVPTMKGLYIIRLDWVDNKPGTYKGLPYRSVRHRCDYSILIEQVP